MVIFDTFPAIQTLAPPWHIFEQGQGQVYTTEQTIHLTKPATNSYHYTNAQLDDYHYLNRGDFLWQAPLRLTVRARFSHPCGILHGTAGFGFWNAPPFMTNHLRPTIPRVIWFFYSSPHSNIQFAQGIPGFGWKAATLDGLRPAFFALLPTAPIAIPLMNIRPLYNLCWPIGQQAINVSEAILPVEMTAWHTYTLLWYERTAHFLVDNYPVLECTTAPHGPLGFVMWLDNQYMVATPWGCFDFGLIETPQTQSMEVSQLIIEPLGVDIPLA